MTSTERLSDVTDFILDGTHGSPERTEGGIPVLSAQNVNGGGLNYSTDRYTSETEYRAFRRRLAICPGDVLLTIVGSIGRTAIVEEDRPIVFQRSVAVLRPKRDALASSYLRHAIQSQCFQSQLASATNQSSQAGVYLGKLKELRIPLPPMEEQRRIAAILDQAEALRAKRRQALAKLDTLTQSLFLEMFGDPRWNPKKWKIEHLAELGVVSGGLQLTPRRSALPLSVPYLRVANVYRDKIDLTEVKTMGVTEAELARTALQPGDLLIVEGHGNPEEIGRSAVWNGQIETCVHQNHLIRVRFNRDVIDPLFASTYLNSKSGREQVLKSGKTTSGLNTLSTANVKSFRLFAPPMSKQKEFRDAAMRLRKELDSQQAHSFTLDSLSSSLQHRAFRGEL